MAKPWIDQPALKSDLAKFFQDHKAKVTDFGTTVNQCFEAYVFASVVNWYEEHGWEVTFVHPDGATKMAKLKFNTKGRPNKYTYAICKRSGLAIQVRHALRVATRHCNDAQTHRANVVLDVAVFDDCDLSDYGTSDALDNRKLITFAEAKHMSAFAELVVGFIGMVHEICPDRLTFAKKRRPKRSVDHLPPFLYVSGHLNPTARGILETIEARKMDINIFDYTMNLTQLKLHVEMVSSQKGGKRQNAAKTAAS